MNQKMQQILQSLVDRWKLPDENKARLCLQIAVHRDLLLVQQQLLKIAEEEL